MFRRWNSPALLFLRNSMNPNPLPLLFRRFEASTPTTNSNSNIVSYLINQCGLSPESAISASKRIHFETSSRADSVLALLKNHGFSESDITRAVKSYPMILQYHSQKTLLPKFEFFYSIGVSRLELPSILLFDPKLLLTSLKKRIIPNYEFLKGFLQSDEKVIRVVKRVPWILLLDLSKNLVRNIEHLRKLGVPDNCLSLLLTSYHRVLVLDQAEFDAAVDEVRRIGFDPMKTQFVTALRALAGKTGKFLFRRSLKVYERWGWSKDEVLMAFRKFPHCMMLSEDKIEEGMDFYVNKMGVHSQLIASCPKILSHSMEKRIKPRCSVIKVLTQNGILRKDLALASIVAPSDMEFQKRSSTHFEEEFGFWYVKTSSELAVFELCISFLVMVQNQMR
ncbi:Transcription termination factor, mitochondrial/chloroplastic [Dillenia turbinata]|uniref:Transcription termination factor, mitochondrial/chloroplastic n=1 Tax=Dillenia turbinata TaxID=194707 RepID=A0AAN8ULH2_9MAGN